MPARYETRNRDIYFDAGLRGWLRTTARAEHWRVASWYGVDDLVQDGFICYCKCRDKYTLGPPDDGHQDLFNLDDGTPNLAQRKHFMSLVQRAFYNHIYTLALKYSASTEQPMAEALINEDGESKTLDELLPLQLEETSLLVAVRNAPAEIGDAIGRLINDGLDGGRFLRSRLRKMPNGRLVRGKRTLRETSNERIARIIGDPDLRHRTMSFLLS